MKVLGIIAEYNPFHNGHKYHIKEAKQITGADYVIAVMSGDFVQRGTPAIISKYDRTMMALNNGIDLVLELPTYYSTASAQYFALGAVSLLDQLQIVDSLCFGSECGDITILEEAAKLFNNPGDSFQSLLYSYIREGMTYPASRAKVTKQILGADKKTKTTSMLDAISEPNNILGIEYIRALLQIKSSIKPFTIKRHKAHYHDMNIDRQEGLSNVISSATAIRNILEKNKDSSELITSVSASLPQNIYDYFIDNNYNTFPITIEDFSSIIKYKLMSESSAELAEYMDISSDLADRMKNLDIQNYSITDLSQMIKSKNITLTRVNRALIHTLLNVKKSPFQTYLDDKIIYYARILGIKKEASPLVRKIKNSGELPVITKVSKAYEQLDNLGMQMLNHDIFATHLYNQVVYDKFKTSLANEYKRGICIL